MFLLSSSDCVFGVSGSSVTLVVLGDLAIIRLARTLGSEGDVVFVVFV